MSRDSALAVLSGETPSPVAEVTSVETPVAPLEPAKDLESSRLALFAKKEAAIVRDREEFKKQRQEWEEEKGRFKPLMEKGQRFEELIKSDAVEALRLMGMTDAQILNTFANVTGEKAPTPPEELARIAAQEEIKKFQEQEAAKAADAEAKRHASILDKFNKDITKTIAADPDKFEYCKYYGPVAEGLIHETVAEVLKAEGQLISIKEAAELVENYYEEQDKAMSSLKKRTPEKKTIEAAKSDAKMAMDKYNQNAKTLTNKAAATTASTIQKTETRAEKRERLENMLRNGLSK